MITVRATEQPIRRPARHGRFVAPREGAARGDAEAIVKPSLRTLIEIVLTVLMLLALVTALARRSPAPPAPLVDRAVVLHLKSLIYHCPACELVRRCGADCVTVDISEARRRGAKPCAACGGECLAEE